jgi:23S rRNA pseudouridine2605 synthase
MRINKFIASNLGISRRNADTLIIKGEIKKNNQLALIGDSVDKNDKVCYLKDKKWYTIITYDAKTILFCKPIFTLVSKKPELGKKTIYDVIPKTFSSLKPAGRLDYMSEGLLVLSSDGDLIFRLTHPSNETIKKYVVGFTSELKQNDIKKLSKGVTIDDYKLREVKISKISEKKMNEYNFLNLNPITNWYEFTLKEGRNNQIRKMAAMFEYKIVRLIRVQHGEFLLNDELKNKKIVIID